MADEKVRVTELPVADTLREGAKILINQSGVDYQADTGMILQTQNNLSEIDPVTARSNLNLYSTSEVDTRVKLAVKATVAESVEDGLSKTAIGELFVVPQGAGAAQSFIYYRNSGTTATQVADEAGSGAIDEVRESVDKVDTRTSGANIQKGGENPIEWLDEQGKALLYMDDTGKWYMPGGLSTQELQLAALTLDQMTTGTLDVKLMENGGNKIQMEASERYLHAEVDSGGRVLFGTLKGTGEKEYLGYPLRNKVGLMKNDFFFIGDSITAFTQTTSGAYNDTNRNEKPTVTMQGWPIWAEMISEGRIKYAGLSATGGYRTDQILSTHVPVAVAAKPTFCVVLAGRNDVVQNIATATAVANLKSIYETLRKAGITPVLCSMSAQSGNTTAQDTNRYAINEFIRAYAEKYDLPFVDFHKVTTDPATGQWFSGWNYDASHPTGTGAQAMGAELYRAMAPWVGNVTPRMAESNTTPATSTNLLANPTFLNSSDNILADGWKSVAAGNSTFTTETGIKGKAWNLIADGGTMARVYQTVTVTPGTRYAFGVKVKMNTDGTNYLFVTQGTDDTGTAFLAGIRRWSKATDGFGYFYQEFTVPTGVTSVSIVAIANNMSVGQIGLFKITEV